GRELLTGRTVDTNSAWIAARLTDLGAFVARIVAVDDDPAAIAREIAGARERGVALVITTGGLGPTLDDRTLAGVAAALERRLVEHPAALAFVARRYAELAAAHAVAGAAPGIDLKSLATAFAPDCDLRVRITARAATRAEAEARIARAAERLAAELARLR